MNKSLFRGAGGWGAAMFKGLPCWQVHTAQLKAGNLLALDLDPVGLRWGLT